MREWIGDQKDLALLIARIGFGLVFLGAGVRHVSGLEGYTNFYSSIGIPAPEVMAPFVAYLELIGGVAVLLGIFSRTAGLLLAVTMLVAIIKARIPAIYAPRDGVDPEVTVWSLIQNIQSELLLMSMGLAFLFVGAGAWSLDRLIFKKSAQ